MVVKKTKAKTKAKRKKRARAKDSEIVKVIKYLIPKNVVEKTESKNKPSSVNSYLDNKNFGQARSGYLNPYLVQSAEQQVIHRENKAYITPQGAPVLSEDKKTANDEMKDYVKEQYRLRGFDYPSVGSTRQEQYFSVQGKKGNIEEIYKEMVKGGFNWTLYGKKHPKNPDLQQAETKKISTRSRSSNFEQKRPVVNPQSSLTENILNNTERLDIPNIVTLAGDHKHAMAKVFNEQEKQPEKDSNISGSENEIFSDVSDPDFNHQRTDTEIDEEGKKIKQPLFTMKNLFKFPSNLLSEQTEKLEKIPQDTTQTKKTLENLAKSLKITGSSRMTKEDLINIINKTRSNA